jgi:hypothetical protein
VGYQLDSGNDKITGDEEEEPQPGKENPIL